MPRHRLYILGVGSFGAVKLVVDRTTKVGYALKIMLKLSAVPNWSRTALRERTILSAVQGKHPFVYGLVEAYQDERYLYMLLPMANGGELSKVLKEHAPLSLSSSRFYVGVCLTHTSSMSKHAG